MMIQRSAVDGYGNSDYVLVIEASDGKYIIDVPKDMNTYVSYYVAN